jgi:coproporphyrinogen III oxidase-like Fe-S oxidoreductase
MKLQLAPEQPLIKFDRQLPVFNWPYPFNGDGSPLTDPLRPYLFPRPRAGRTAVYVHVPFCETIWGFFPFQREKTRSSATVDRYVEALVAEFALKSRYIGRPAIDAIFIGGGTPSVLEPHHINKLGAALAESFDLGRLAEFSCEVEVKSSSRQKLLALKAIGVNRVSFGVQTFSAIYRRIFSLDATYDQIRAAASELSSLFAYTNVDILYGLDGQTLAAVEADIISAVELGTTTIDAYPINNLSVSRATHAAMAQHMFQPLREATRVEFRAQIGRLLSQAGYAPISGYGFSRKHAGAPDTVQHTPKFLYHDMVYGHDTDEIIGYGSSAFSRLRGFNICNTHERQRYVSSLVDAGDLPQTVYETPLAPERGIVTFPFRGELNKALVDWENVPADTLNALCEARDAGLVTDRGGSLSVTFSGWLFYVNLMYYFMPENGKRAIEGFIKHEVEVGKLHGETDLRSLWSDTTSTSPSGI